MFPRFRRQCEKVVPIKNRPVSYGTSLALMKKECQVLGLPRITLHAGRAGAATAADRAGVRRSVIKAGGGWKSDAVDSYIRVDKPGVIVSKKVLERM